MIEYGGPTRSNSYQQHLTATLHDNRGRFCPGENTIAIMHPCPRAMQIGYPVGGSADPEWLMQMKQYGGRIKPDKQQWL